MVFSFSVIHDTEPHAGFRRDVAFRCDARRDAVKPLLRIAMSASYKVMQLRETILFTYLGKSQVQGLDSAMGSWSKIA